MLCEFTAFEFNEMVQYPNFYMKVHQASRDCNMSMLVQFTYKKITAPAARLSLWS